MDPWRSFPWPHNKSQPQAPSMPRETVRYLHQLEEQMKLKKWHTSYNCAGVHPAMSRATLPFCPCCSQRLARVRQGHLKMGTGGGREKDSGELEGDQRGSYKHRLRDQYLITLNIHLNVSIFWFISTTSRSSKVSRCQIGIEPHRET